MASREEVPKVNAGSMADIAFLLLIFFLVTTSIETDAGLDRKLPSDSDTSVVIAERNILPILINGKNEVMVDSELVDVRDLKALTIAFLDNGGALNDQEGYCDYCQGSRAAASSDHPQKAIVSLMSSRETSYATYIKVQNELVGAYNVLRNREAQRHFKTDFTALEAMYSNEETAITLKSELKRKIQKIQELYPMKLSEAARN